MFLKAVIMLINENMEVFNEVILTAVSKKAKL